MRVEERLEVDVVELVAVERVERPALFPLRRGEADAAAPTKRLGLRDCDDLRPEPGQLRAEKAVLPASAADNDALDAGAHELRHLVLGQRMAGDGDEGLRLATGRIAEARRLSAREDDRLH